MASVQVETKIKEEHKPIIHGLQKEAANLKLCALPNQDQPQATTKAVVRNDTSGPISFKDNKDWSGSVIGHYPHFVAVGGSGKFLHQGTIPPGSNGAVVYYGTNLQGHNNCAWVLAWNTLGDDNTNQIYVETGASANYQKGSIDWEAIKTSLDESSNKSYYIDDDTGAEASAEISSGTEPKVAVVFDITL